MGVFSDELAQWYALNKRDLPWRNTQDPYKIWISEIILQQTRVAEGLPYYHRFIDAFPYIKDLADAEEDTILRLWQGLGYYSRARNLHAAAKQVTNDFNGNFPATYKELLGLKGVGNYTAAAIASFAFHEKIAVVDGNVYRVLARYLGIETDLSSSKAHKEFQEAANQLLPLSDTHVHNQAIMEFGALQCVPKSPDCSICPLAASCVARASGRQGILPIKTKKTKITKRYINYLAIETHAGFYMKKRSEKDIWAGLYDFPSIEGELSLQEIQQQIPNISRKIILHSKVTHLLSHQRLLIRFYHIKLSDITADIVLDAQLTDYKTVNQVGKPIVIERFLKSLHS